jgi:catechol 2,3-dioxygenase-like lactoylglutathione lyase family enzyme
MIDHVSIAVSDLEKSTAFYQGVLGALGFEKLVERGRSIGFGKKYPEFWLNYRSNFSPISKGTGNHICLRAPLKEAVTRFYNLALSFGGQGDGEPGDREGAMTTYFGAFIRDPDGNKVEAVFFPRPSIS